MLESKMTEKTIPNVSEHFVRYLDAYGQFQQNCQLEFNGYIFDVRTVMQTWQEGDEGQIVLDVMHRPIAFDPVRAAEFFELRESVLRVALTKYYLAYSNADSNSISPDRGSDSLSE